jgi:hypothetical protein
MKTKHGPAVVTIAGVLVILGGTAWPPTSTP